MTASPAPLALAWRGPATVQRLERALKRGATVRLALPLEMHHALFRHLNPGAAPSAPEGYVVEGDAALLPRIATVAGLEALGRLEPAARAAGYRVALDTTDPLLVLSPAEPS
jgi:hypothetical protein